MMRAALEEFRQFIMDKAREVLIEIALALFTELNRVESELHELQEVHNGIIREYQKIKETNEKYRSEIDTLRKQNQHLTNVTTLRTNDLFGRSSEKTEDILNRAVTAGNTDETDPVDEDADDGTIPPDLAVDSMAEAEVRRILKEMLGDKEKKKKEKGKRERDLAKQPVRDTHVYDIDELNAAYGDGWKIIGWVKIRTVEKIRSSCYLQNTYIPKIETIGGQIVSPYRTEPLIEKSLVSPSLMASILYDKYKMFLPYYRQENDPERFGFPISSQTMSNWEIHICEEFFMPVYDHLKKLMRLFEYQHCDETPWMVVQDGRRAGAKGYMWAHLSGELLTGIKIAFIAFELTRESTHLKDFFEGIEHLVHLTDDAYSGYYSLQKTLPDHIVICGCLTHCRRRFVEAILVMRLRKGMTVEELMEIPEYRCILMIAEIYKVDEPLKQLTAEERLKTRKEKEQPLFDAFIEYIQTIDITAPDVSSKFKDAINYTLNHERELREFLRDGNVPIDNGAVERLIRDVARLRVNSLFSTTARGAETSAVIISLMQTAALNDADPYYYMKYLMEELPRYLYHDPCEYIEDMMPWAEKYRTYEGKERQRTLNCLIPPEGISRPKIRKLLAGTQVKARAA